MKTFAPLILLVLLGGFAFYYTQADTNTQYSPEDDWVMHVEDIESIERVFIADRNGGTADVIKDGKKWIYNNKYTANPNVVSNLLHTINSIRMKNRPTKASIPKMIKSLSTKSTKVEVYGKNDKLLKAFYIGGVTPDERGTFMILEGSENPYVMHIPMNEVSLKHRFFTGDKKWRDKTVLELQPSDIASISVEYPKRKNKSFKLKRDKRKWTAEPFFQTTKKIDKPVNQDLVESYLKGFKKIGAEAIHTPNEQSQKTLNAREFCIVKMILTDGSHQQINFFPILKFASEDADTPLPVERYYAVNEKGDIFLTQHIVFKEIFWAYDFFF